MIGSARVAVDPIACDGRGLCAELLPGFFRLDDWGFPSSSAATCQPNYGQKPPLSCGCASGSPCGWSGPGRDVSKE